MSASRSLPPFGPQRALEVTRFLAGSAAPVGAGQELQDTLDRVVAAVVQLVGFEVAVLNLAVEGDLLEVVSTAGPDAMRARLLGTCLSRRRWEQTLEAASPMGNLRFVHHDDASEDDVAVSWVPDLPVVDDPGAWHPLDALFAPLRGAGGDLLGVLSVDCPVGGRRPDRRVCDLLELLAVQASLALDNAQVHRRLARQEQAFRTLFEHAPIGMAVSGLDRVIIAVNQAYCTFVGRTAQALIGSPAADLTHPADARESDRNSDEVRARAGTVGKIDKRYVRGDGSVVWGRLSLIRVPGGDGGKDIMVAQVEDITAERAARAALEQQARTDSLTGLANRETVLADLAAAVAAERPVAVLFCDVDDFKVVNDTLGHAAGDQLLVLIARDLRAVLRPGDSAGRIGGDEFLVVLDDIGDRADAEAVAERIRRVSTRSIDGVHGAVTTSVAVGLALSQPGQSAGEVLARADRALYEAKRAGNRRAS
ncbi:MAG TPA: diguanylate cyclase [Mycobacteriales bacterium]|nr:diguanylate cyclase [Mycobacteriales bacterium]